MNKKASKWIYEHGKGSYLIIGIMTILTSLLALISLKFVGLSRKLIDIATGIEDGILSHTIGFLLSMLLLQLIIQVIVNFLNVHASSRMEIAMKRHLFKTIMQKDYLAITKYHSGELLNRLNSDISVIVSGIITIVPSLALFLTSIIGGFIYLYTIDRALALIILAIGPFVAIGARIYSTKYKALHKECQEANGKTSSFMLEIIQNLLVVKSFNNEKTVVDHSESLQNRSYKLRVKRAKISIIAHVGLFLIFNAGYYFAVAYGALKISQNTMNYGEFIAIIQLVNQIQTPFKNISSLIPQAFSVIASAERILELESTEDENIKDEITDVDSLYSRLSEIVFDNVEFKYNKASVVSGIDMSFKKGECVAIGGESGIGKTTALKLLLGIFEPSLGSIYIKTEDGKKIPVNNSTRPMFSYVPQGNLVLSGTIRENITFANENATDEEIISALKIAQLWEFVERLENGLDTYIGEKGLGLSEGQAQRLSIARAILYDAPVLLLDECTSALDSETEKKLLNSIKSMTNKTCLIISHKQAAFDICDHVEYVKKTEDN